MKKKEEKSCGCCCWYYAEDTYGYGACPYDFGVTKECGKRCSTGEFVSKEQMRHYLAILVQANRYRRDQHVPSIYRMPNPTELGKAIDFSVRYIKEFSQL